MTLSNDPTKPDQPPAETSKPTLQTSKKKTPKMEKAIELAKKYIDLPYAAARNRIMEEVPCNKSTAHKAYHIVKEQANKKTEATTEKNASIQIISESDSTPEFLEKLPKSELQPEEPLEITAAEQPATIAITDDQQQQLDLFRDMLRGTYTMLFSREGILGEKYGRTKQQCENLADMQYRWLVRRYDVADLSKFDTILLVGAYGTLFAGIAKDYMAERKKLKAEKRAA